MDFVRFPTGWSVRKSSRGGVGNEVVFLSNREWTLDQIDQVGRLLETRDTEFRASYDEGYEDGYEKGFRE